MATFIGPLNDPNHLQELDWKVAMGDSKYEFPLLTAMINSLTPST